MVNFNVYFCNVLLHIGDAYLDMTGIYIILMTLCMRTSNCTTRKIILKNQVHRTTNTDVKNYWYGIRFSTGGILWNVTTSFWFPYSYSRKTLSPKILYRNSDKILVTCIFTRLRLYKIITIPYSVRHKYGPPMMSVLFAHFLCVLCRGQQIWRKKTRPDR